MGSTVKKFGDTLRICGVIMMARTFGYYVNSGWDGHQDYAEYVWRNRACRIPTFPRHRTVTEDELLAALKREYQR